MEFTSLALTGSNLQENLSIYATIGGEEFIFYRVDDLIQIQDPNDPSNNITLFYKIFSTINRFTFTLLKNDEKAPAFTSKQLGREWSIAFYKD